MRIVLLLLTITFFFNSNAQDDSIKILSWNVFLRPAILKDGQIKRVDSIAEYLNSSGADVLVLQEVFHRRARKKLVKNIKSEYPFITRIGPFSFWGISSGVMIASKDSIQRTKRISFKRSTGADKLAKKGGVAATLKHNDNKYNVIGTHLQAGKGKERESIRRSQFMKLKKLSRTVKSFCKAPIIYAGDFNIPFESDNFGKLVDSLNTTYQKPTGDIKSTSNFKNSDLYPSEGKPKWIDFILIENHQNIELSNCEIEEPRARYSDTPNKQRLSDHNPIISTVILKNEE